MSALRKLRQLKMNAEAAAAAPQPSDVTEEEEKPAQPARNAFDMLADEEEEEEEQQQEEEAEQPAAAQPAAAAAASSDEDADAAPVAASPTPTPKPKAKKKPSAAKGETAAAASKAGGGGKKKKGAAASAVAAPEKEAWEVEFANAQAESAQAGQNATASASSASATSVWEVLRTDARALDAQQEIRAVFGSGMERRGGGGGGDDDGAAAAAQGIPGRNQGGFRRGGAATVRRVKMATSGMSGAASSSSSYSRRMLVRPNPAWPRTDSSGLIKVGFVQPEQAPVPPASAARSVTKVAAGMHGNIHSLASASDATSSASAASSAVSDAEAQAARAQSEYVAALLRYQRQQQLVLGPGVRLYQFVQSSEFQHVQQEYLECVGSHDVQQLSYFSRLHPFHPASLLTMADILASQSEFSTAHDFIQRCLFVHENGFVGSAEFADKLARGEARMDGLAAENEAFFTALARHAQTLGKKGCPRTAFEVCKLLLSLSPLLDPTSTLLAIDYYAIRAKQYKWMMEFAAQMDRAVISAYPVGHHPWAGRRADAESSAGPTSASNVATLASPSPATSSSSSAASASALPAPRPPCTFLPSLMYSRALAAWHLENEAANGSGDKKKRSGGSASAVSASATPATPVPVLFTGVVSPPDLPSTATGHSMLDEDEAALLSSVAASSDADSTRSASYLLQQALLMWPSVVQPLLAAAGAENALSRPAWTSALAALNALYATSFLSSATAAPSSTPFLAKLELVYAERSSSLWKNDKIQAWVLANLQQLATSLAASPSPYTPELLARFTQARMRFLLSLPFPASIKSLQKSAYSDHVAQLPPELLMAQQHAGAVDMAGERARMRADDLAAAGHRQLDLQQHPLRVFLQSLLPWFAPPDAGVEGEEAAGMGGLPANVDEAMERLQQLPPDEQAELLRNLMLAQEGDDGDEEEEEQAGGLDDYQNYEFDD